MKKALLVLAVIAAAGAFIFSRLNPDFDARVAAGFTAEPCPEVTPREYPDGYYTGPLSDTHFHVPTIPDGPGMSFGGRDGSDQPLLGVNTTMTDIVCMLRSEGTGLAFGFFSVWKEMSEPMIAVVRRTIDEYPGQFVTFLMPPDHDDSPDGFPTVDAATVQSMLALDPGLFAGFGEIGLYARESGSPELPPDDPRMLAIYDILREEKIPVYVHLGRGHQDNFERALDLYPDVNFIFHGDQLVVYEEEGRQNLTALDEILDNHPNAYYGVDELYGDDWLLRPDVSKEQFFSHFTDYDVLLEEDLGTWQRFIERHAEQVLWGTDRGGMAVWTLDADVGLQLTDYSRAFIGRLSPRIQANFAYKNAERLLAK